MAKKAKVTEPQEATVTVSEAGLANAIVTAIEHARPQKKNAATYKRNTPWTPKNGEPQLKLKRKTYHHSIPVIGKLTNQEITLFNQIRPGVYMDGKVKVIRRKDRGIDLDYSVRTAAQRLQLINKYGTRNLADLLEKIVEEQERPKKDSDYDDQD